MYAAVVAGTAIVADAVALCRALQIDLRELLRVRTPTTCGLSACTDRRCPARR
jgi:hypothetical protein